MTAITLSTPPRPWRSHPRETVALGALGLAALLALAGVSGATPTLPGMGEEAKSAVVPPGPLPMTVRDLAPEAALAVNATIPITGDSGPAAAPFILGKTSKAMRTRALDCLTSAIYYEAGQESAAGQRGVAQVILNRVRHPAFPNSVCGVVFEGSTRATGCQFTFTCDHSMERRPVPDLWNRARRVAEAMISGSVFAPAGQATHYHANYVVPYWASSLVKTHIEGAHLFYRWAGGWGRPAAFAQSWSGREADPNILRLTALTAPREPLTVKPESALAQLVAGGADIVQAGGRVRIRFSPEARAAVEKVKVTPYVERVSASDNLRWTLASGEPAATEKSLGKAAETPAPAN
ncbi:MAG: cell wall hydrolase [Sphingomicrobium sp.]